MNAGGGAPRPESAVAVTVGGTPLPPPPPPPPLVPAAMATDDIASELTSCETFRISSILEEQTRACDGVEKLVAEQRVQIDELRSKLREALGRLDRQRELFRRRERELRAIYEEDLCQLDEDYRRAYHEVAAQQREAQSSSLQRAALFGARSFVRDGQPPLALASAQLSPRQRPQQQATPVTRAACPVTLLSKAVQASWSYASRRNASTNTDRAWAAAPVMSRGIADRQVSAAARRDCAVANSDGGGALHLELLRTVAESNAWTLDLAARLGRAGGTVGHCASQLEQFVSTAARRAQTQEGEGEEDSNQNGNDAGAEKSAQPPIARRRPPPTLLGAGTAAETGSEDGRRRLALQAKQPAAPSLISAGKEELEQDGDDECDDDAEDEQKRKGDCDGAVLVRSAAAASASAAERDEDASINSLRSPQQQQKRQHSVTAVQTADDASPNSRWSTADDHFAASPSPTSCASVDSLECASSGGCRRAMEGLLGTAAEPFPSKSSDSLERFAEQLLASYPRAAPAK